MAATRATTPAAEPSLPFLGATIANFTIFNTVVNLLSHFADYWPRRG